MDILLHGACGRMCREVEKLIEITEGMYVVARVDKLSSDKKCFTDINDFDGKADVIIDFSNHTATKELMEYAVRKHIPVVVCTTGQTDEEIRIIKKASEKTPVFFSANMSLGIALLVDLSVKTASVMKEADIEITETHHNRKLDSPSGTALLIAENIKKIRNKAKLKFGRYGHEKREKDEICIHSVRRGNIAGIHEVVISTDSQTITLKHEAHSSTLFAEGAVKAALFIKEKKSGLYDMNFLLGE